MVVSLNICICLQTVLDSIGVSIWQMATAPYSSLKNQIEQKPLDMANGHANNKFNHDDDETSDSDSEDDDSLEIYKQPRTEETFVAIACDDGCVRIYYISDSETMTYVKSLTRVSGEVAEPSGQVIRFVI